MMRKLDPRNLPRVSPEALVRVATDIKAVADLIADTEAAGVPLDPAAEPTAPQAPPTAPPLVAAQRRGR